MDAVQADREYRADPRANYSSLKRMEISPLAYKRCVAGPSQDTLDVGLATHMAILEPDQFLNHVTYYPGKQRRGKEWEAFKAEHPGFLILKKTDYQRSCEMAERVFDHKVARELIEAPGVAERPFYDVDEETGIARKCKPDKLMNYPMVVELKTARSCVPDAFGRQVASLKYHAQAAYYCDITGAKEHQFIVVDNGEPFDVIVYTTPPEVLDEGRLLYRRWLDRLRECLDQDSFPGYEPDGTVELQLPAYAYELDNEGDESGLDGLIP